MIKSICIEKIFTEVDFYDRFAEAAKAGFSHVEFWSWSTKDLDRVMAELDKHGLSVASISGDQGYSLVCADEREGYLEYLRRSIEAAKTLDCPTLVVHSDAIGPTARFPPPQRTSPTRRSSRQPSKRCGKAASWRARRDAPSCSKRSTPIHSPDATCMTAKQRVASSTTSTRPTCASSTTSGTWSRWREISKPPHARLEAVLDTSISPIHAEGTNRARGPSISRHSINRLSTSDTMGSSDSNSRQRPIHGMPARPFVRSSARFG